MRFSRFFPVVHAAIAAILIVAAPVAASAQEKPPSLFGGTLKATVIDPTTYAPSVVLYGSMMLDWNSSQPFFRHGFVEDNPRYTVNGLPHDVPLSYGAGKQQILKDALAIVPSMMVNNAASHLLERTLIRRHPEHRKALHVLGAVQRVALSAFVSYRLSANHFEQWQMNQRRASELGYR